MARRQNDKWADQADAQAYQEQQAAPPLPPQAYAAPAPAAPADDKLAQLKDSGALKEAGVLTDAEIEAQKAKILAG